MVFVSLKEAFGLLKTYPVIWLTGIVAGILSAVQLLLMASDGAFYADRIMILQVVALPFFIAGSIGVISRNDGSFRVYMQEGMKNYFRILLPGILIFFAALVTAILVMVPIMLIGAVPDPSVMTMVMFGVFIPFAFFTFFYDMAAVFEDRKVLSSIRRSIEVVLLRPFPVLKFFFVMILICFVVGMGAVMVWSVALAGPLEPIATMTQAELENVSQNPYQLMEMIGNDGMVVTALIYLLATFLIVNILYPFKAAFYRRYAKNVTIATVYPEEEGEYDEKGRWYKYS